jgi:hypothetical protein
MALTLRLSRIMAAWIAELPVQIRYGCEVTGFASLLKIP